MRTSEGAGRVALLGAPADAEEAELVAWPLASPKHAYDRALC